MNDKLQILVNIEKSTIVFLKSLGNKSYYNPKYKPSTYKLSSEEIKKVLQLFQAVNLEQLKSEYRVGMSDQPTSTTTIYTKQKKVIIKDYGLEGDYPLKEVYRIVYKY